jgi:hypothetical protein
MEVDSQESLTTFDLPEEIWIHIFRWLDVKSVQNSQLVCKKWIDFILNDVILSAEYTFSSKIMSSSQINDVLAKRKKLKIIRFPFPYQHPKEGDIPYEFDKDGTTFDLQYVDFKVCKDLKKVFVQNTPSDNRDFVKMPPLPCWLHPSLFWFNPSNKIVSFGPENTIELTLFIMPETGNFVDPSLELVAKEMISLEKLSVHFSPEDTVDNIDFIVPLLKGLRNCQSLQQLEIFCKPSGRLDYFDNLG